MEQSTKQPTQSSPELPTAEQQLFIGTLISLSWQLLFVVVVPFVGGHYLDVRYKTTPLYTLIGLGVALSLAGLVTYRNYQILTTAQQRPGPKHD